MKHQWPLPTCDRRTAVLIALYAEDMSADDGSSLLAAMAAAAHSNALDATAARPLGRLLLTILLSSSKLKGSLVWVLAPSSAVA